VSQLSLAPMAPVTVSLGYRPRNLIRTVQALKGAAHICEAVNRAFSADVLGFARNLGRCLRLNVEFCAVGAKQKM
jgi:hypothetical protein